MAKRQSKNRPEPKQPINVSQTVNIGQTWDSAAFAKLLQEQAKSNETAIKQLETAMGSASANQQQLAEQIAQSSMMKDIKEILIAELQDKKFQQLKEEALKKKQEEAEAIKKANDQLKENIQLRSAEAKAIANIAKNMETFRTIGDRFSDLSKKLKDSFGSLSALKTTALKAFNFGGIFNKSIAREKFIQTQRKLGSEDDRKTLSTKFEAANKAAKEIKKNEAEFSEFKKETGLSESELAKTKKGKELLSKRDVLSEEFAKSDLKASLVKREETTPEPTPVKKESAGVSEEAIIEQQKVQEKQQDLLLKIEENTRGDKPAPDARKVKPEEDKGGGGLLGKLMGGGGMGKALSSLKDFGVGIILVAGALWVASKAFQSFAEVEWEDVGKGLVALGGLVLAAIGLDKVKGSILKGAASLGVLGLAIWGISAAFKEFASLEWETIGKAFGTIIGLGVVGAVLGTFAAPALLGAAALGALGAAVWLVGKGFQEMQEPFEAFIQGIEKLSNVGFQGLAGVAAGLALLGPAMAIFAAGNVAAGLSNLVTGFLSAVTGQKTPVDQLVEIGKSGEGIGKAGAGMEQLGKAMKAFSGIKKDDLKALDAFPWEKATKFVAAGGSMSANGAVVTNASKANADEAAKADGAKGGSTAIVNAPINNTTRQNQIIKPQIRNQESSQSRYISNRYGIV
jgi:hypothetical protein